MIKSENFYSVVPGNKPPGCRPKTHKKCTCVRGLRLKQVIERLERTRFPETLWVAKNYSLKDVISALKEVV